jgi:hypothetical protein
VDAVAPTQVTTGKTIGLEDFIDDVAFPHIIALLEQNSRLALSIHFGRMCLLTVAWTLGDLVKLGPGHPVGVWPLVGSSLFGSPTASSAARSPAVGRQLPKSSHGAGRRGNDPRTYIGNKSILMSNGRDWCFRVCSVLESLGMEWDGSVHRRCSRVQFRNRME